MRPVGLGDLVAAAAALAAVAPDRRAALMAVMLAEADAADRHRACHGHAHPAFGNGTLMARALARPQARFVPGDPEGLATLALAAEMVLAICAQPTS